MRGNDADDVISILRGVAVDTVDPEISRAKNIKRRSSRVAKNPAALASLTLPEVEYFIKDETNSKEDLMDLASARFSMSRSQLRRLRLPEVRAAIHSAVLHESSIQILSEQARKEGSTRSS
ncbi:MAG: hypothetical protein ACREBW_00955 [Candidatus Micrarchaeaceae archaeon]